MAEPDHFDSLCQTCRGIFDGNKTASDNLENGYEHHSILSLQASSREDCRVCKILWRGLQHSVKAGQGGAFLTFADGTYGEDRRPTYFIRHPYKITGYKGDASFHLDFQYSARGSWTSVPIYLVAAESKCFGPEGMFDLLRPVELSPFTTIPTESVSTSSQASLDTALAWLRRCNETHSICKQSRSSWGKLPTRLLEISESLVLRNTGELLPETPYTTLSHCWGNIPISRLLQSNLKSFMEDSIPFEELPQTFRDAVSFTKMIGLRYIWIDSLCIIQDSQDDWLRESAEMCKVYSNGFCNLAATALSDGRGGLFRNRDLESFVRCRVDVTWDGVELQKGQYDFVGACEWTREVSAAPLNLRAWVLQERLLARRLLHFGAYQIYWECKELSASETYPDGLPNLLGSVGIVDRWKPWTLLKPESSSLDDAHASKCHSHWGIWAGNYSHYGLTKEFDKLVALSGLARATHEYLGGRDVYLAGLWKSRLLSHLLWSVKYSDSCRRPTAYRAPSWSWASLDVPMTILESDPGPDDARRETLLATILDAYTVPLIDPFGPIIGGAVRIRGPLLRVAIQPQFNDQVHLSTEMVLKGPRNGSYRAWVRADEGMTPTTNVELDIHWLVFNSYFPAEARIESRGDIPTMSGLLLLPTRKAKGQFVRFGTVFLIGNTFHKSIREALIDSDLEYEEEDSKTSFIVTII